MPTCLEQSVCAPDARKRRTVRRVTCQNIFRSRASTVGGGFREGSSITLERCSGSYLGSDRIGPSRILRKPEVAAQHEVVMGRVYAHGGLVAVGGTGGGGLLRRVRAGGTPGKLLSGTFSHHHLRAPSTSWVRFFFFLFVRVLCISISYDTLHLLPPGFIPCLVLILLGEDDTM